LLAEAVPNLKERTDLDTVFSDGGYGGPQADVVLQEHNVTLIQTAHRGRSRDPERLYLDDFEIESDAQDIPQQVVCPAGERAAVRLSESGKTFHADFPLSTFSPIPSASSRRTQSARGACTVTYKQVSRGSKPKRGRQQGKSDTDFTD